MFSAPVGSKCAPVFYDVVIAASTPHNNTEVRSWSLDSLCAVSAVVLVDSHVNLGLGAVVDNNVLLCATCSPRLSLFPLRLQPFLSAIASNSLSPQREANAAKKLYSA